MPDRLGSAALEQEAQRIRAEYERRARDIPDDYYALSRPAVLFAAQQRTRGVLRALCASGMMPLAERTILDVGCGRGDWLIDFETWGASRRLLAGIDLDPAAATRARGRTSEQRDERGKVLNPGADIRIGDASALPWPDAAFDIVVLSTVFSSILNPQMKEAVAHEISRVIKPTGIVLWYDFFVNNPSNDAVRGVRRAEINQLFPSFHADLKRTTLAPPLARRLVPLTWVGAAVLEAATLLNTHYLGVLRPKRRH